MTFLFCNSKSKIMKALSIALTNDSTVNNRPNKKSFSMSSSSEKVSLSVLANLKQFSADENENREMLLRICQLVSSIKLKSFLNCSNKYCCKDTANNCHKKTNKSASQTRNCHKNANKKLHLDLKSKLLINKLFKS